MLIQSELKRIDFFDMARVLSMTWVVAFLHLFSSLKDIKPFTSPLSHCITIASLSTFTFISGFFLSKKIEKITDIKKFYISRFIKLYPLYFLSCLSMHIAYLIRKNPQMMNFRQFILSILGLSTIIGPSPITLWYFSMLLLFYAITPLICLLNNVYYKIIFVFIIMFLIAESKMIIKADSRLLLYFHVYAIGIFAGEYCKHYVINFSFWNIYNIIGILISLLFCSIYIAGICKYNLLNLSLISITSFMLILNF